MSTNPMSEPVTTMPESNNKSSVESFTAGLKALENNLLKAGKENACKSYQWICSSFRTVSMLSWKASLDCSGPRCGAALPRLMCCCVCTRTLWP